MSNTQTKSCPQPGARVRAFRERTGISLDGLADRIKEAGADRRPSAAKLSRIENGRQPVAMDILEHLASITGISARDLRPDYAAKFGRRPQAA